jgi:(S)-ureidoglycine---glyoxylate transaminase
MGYNCRKQNVLICLGALELVLRRAGFALPPGGSIDDAYAGYEAR